MMIIQNKNCHRNNKNNNYMHDSSNKQNTSVDKQQPRFVTFHFCQRYAKKGERRTKTQAPESHPRIIRGSKMILITKGKNLQQESKKQKKHQLSNFQMLKRKISYLETQQFLGDKSQRNVLKEKESNPQHDYVVSGEFGHSKRISVLEKYRQNIKNIKRQSERRKPSLNLIIKAQDGQSYSKLAFQFAPPSNLEIEGNDWLIKKREIVTQCAKRYFRPQSFNRSKEAKLIDSVAEIKGTRFQHSGRVHKSTINFY